MEKLTDFQIENLIESMIQKNKKTNRNKLKEYYTKKWYSCKTKKERFNFLDEFFIRKNKMINEGYDVSLDENVLVDLFKSGIGGGVNTFKEWFASKVVNGVARLFGSEVDRDLLNAISIGLANLDWTQDLGKLLSPVKNCKFISDLLIDSVLEYYIDKKIDKTFGDTVIGDTLRNAVVDALNDEKHVQAIQNVFNDMFCKVLTSMFGGGGSIMDKMGGLFGGGKTPSPVPAGAS